MTPSPKRKLFKRQRLSSVLGLTLDGSRLDGLVLQRNNAAFTAQSPFSISLSLDPLTAAPELVGREIRNHLDTAGIRERNCILGLPLKWALTAHIELPELPEADLASFLQIEAERIFPCDVQTLYVATSRCQPPGAKEQALLVGVPRTHLLAIEKVLHAAKLKAVSFSLAINALQPAGADGSNGVLALAIGETQVALQISCAGGVAALRTLDGALEVEGGQRVLHADHVVRETRITLSQLPAAVREAVRRVRVFGPRDLAQQLADEMELRFESMGLVVERVERYAANEFGAQLPGDPAVSPAFSLAGGCLAGRVPVFELLPPKVTAFQQLAARYSSGKLRTTLTAAGAIAAVVGALFFYQQVRLWSVEAESAKIAPTVKELKGLQDQIRQFRDWYDTSFTAMTVLKAISQNFPEDPLVTAKTIEVRDLHTVICTGTARNYQSLLETVKKLRAVPEIRDVNLGSTRGQAPSLQFTFTFTWNEGATSAN